MKKSVLLFSCLLFNSILFSQLVPNRGFETWSAISLGETPFFWNTSNAQAIMGGGGPNCTKSTTRQSGNFSLKMEAILISMGQPDTFPAFVVNSGQINGGPTGLQYQGGFPFTGTPDSLHG